MREHRERGNQGRGGTHLVGALVLLAGEDRFAERRIDGKLGLSSPQLRQFALVVEAAEGVEQLERTHERVGRRRIEKVKIVDVVDADGLEQQHDVCEIGALDLGRRVRIHLVLKRPLREEAEGLSGSDAAGSTGSLIGRGTRALPGTQGCEHDSSSS